jgi:hypothetical protein
MILSQVAALSPERCWIAIASGPSELCRIDGSKAGNFLEHLEENPVSYEFQSPPLRVIQDAEAPMFFKQYPEYKQQYPSLELCTITVPYPNDPPDSDSFLFRLFAFSTKLNAAEFEGRAAGTVWFLGPQCKRRPDCEAGISLPSRGVEYRIQKRDGPVATCGVR